MARKTPYTSITFGTEGLGKLATALGSSERDAKTVVEAMKSASEEAVIFNSNLKKINRQTEEWMNTVLIKGSDVKNAVDAGIRKSVALMGKSGEKIDVPGYFTNAQTEDIYMLEFTRKKMGALSKSLAKEEVSRFRGTFEKTNTDMVKIGYPVSKADFDTQLALLGSEEKVFSYFGKQMDKEMVGSTKKSQEVSRALSKKMKDAEEKRLTEEEAKKNRQEEAERKSEEDRHKKEEDRQKSEEEKKRRQEKAQKERQLHLGVAKTIAILTIIANIVRRVLSAVLQRGTEINQERMQAQAIGISYGNLREYKAQERAMGLKEGLISSAIGSIQSAFGNITSLDDASIKQLALVMGEGVRGLISSGLGAERPEQLMKEILDAYYKRAQQGVNSVGVYVGREKAERELASSLEKAGMKDLADILRNMFYVNKSGIYAGMIGTSKPSEDYFNLVKAYTMGLTNIDITKASELGQVIQVLQKRFNELAENIGTKLLLALSGTIEKINALEFGKSEREKISDSKEARRLLLAKSDELQELSTTSFSQIRVSLKGTPFENIDIENLPEDRLMSLEQLQFFYQSEHNRSLLYKIRQAQIARAKAKEAIKEADPSKAKNVYKAVKYSNEQIISEAREQMPGDTELVARMALSMFIKDRIDEGGDFTWSKYKAKLRLKDAPLDLLADVLIPKDSEELKQAQAEYANLSKKDKETTDLFTYLINKGLVTDADIYNALLNAFVEEEGNLTNHDYGVNKKVRSRFIKGAKETIKEETEDMLALNWSLTEFIASEEAREMAKRDADKNLPVTMHNYDASAGTVDVVVHVVDSKGKEDKQTFKMYVGQTALPKNFKHETTIYANEIDSD